MAMQFTISGDSTPYVANKVVREGPGMPVSDVTKQRLLLLSDLARLARGSWFANRFESRAEELGVEPSCKNYLLIVKASLAHGLIFRQLSASPMPS